jgi:hypothetical protein
MAHLGADVWGEMNKIKQTFPQAKVPASRAASPRKRVRA